MLVSRSSAAVGYAWVKITANNVTAAILGIVFSRVELVTRADDSADPICAGWLTDGPIEPAHPSRTTD